MVDEDLIAPTIVISQKPSALKVTRFYELKNSTQDTSPRLTATVQQSQHNGPVSSSQSLPVIRPLLSELDVIDDELQSRANWEKIVTHKTSRVTPETGNPLVVTGVYKPLVSETPPALISVRRASPKKAPRLSTNYISWISILILFCLLLGGVFGLAVSYGRGFRISLRPSHLLFSRDAIDLGSGDQAMNSAQSVTLSNTGGGQINWQATTTQPWLLISPKSGILSFNQKMNIEVAADRSNLKVGAYGGALVFHSNTGQAALPAKMIVTQLQPGHRAVLQLTPALLSFTATDGAANPLSQVVTVNVSPVWNDCQG